MKHLLFLSIFLTCSIFTFAQEKPLKEITATLSKQCKSCNTNEDYILFYNKKIQETETANQQKKQAYYLFLKAKILRGIPNPSEVKIKNIITKGLTLAKQTQNENLICNFYILAARRANIYGDFKNTRIQLDSAVIYNQNSVDKKKNNFKIYYQKTTLEIRLGNINTALLMAQKSEQYITTEYDELHVNSLLGIIYSSQKKHKKAIVSFQKTIAYFIREKDNGRAAQWLNNIAEEYHLNKNYNKEKKALLQAIAYAKKSNFKYVKASAYRLLANYHLSIDKQLDSTQYYLQQIDKTIPVIEEKEFLADVNSTKGNYYKAINQFEKAITHYKEAYNVWHKLNQKEGLKDITLILSEAHQQNNNYKKALYFHKQHLLYKDSLQNKETIEKFKELELNHKYQKEKLKIKTQHQQEITTEKESKNKITYISVFVGLLGLITLFGFYKKRKKNQVLNTKNAFIEKTLQEKELLVKEVHHRVKNNFQIVSSLLELQSQGIEDKRALELAKDGKNRVKSMALIHQKLYQNEDGNINFEEYIHSLVKELHTLFANGKNITTTITSKNMRFDVDTAIPLGLIINELITNAYKYGFTHKNPELNITLTEKFSGNYQLIVSDNGNGLPVNFEFKKAKSLGLRLVKRLAKQLHGKAIYHNDNGCSFIILFKDTKTRMEVE